MTSQQHISAAFGGLGGGKYACYDESDLQTKYLTCPEGYTPTGAVDNGAFSERGTTVISSNTSGGSTVRFGIVTQSIFFVLSAALVQLAS